MVYPPHLCSASPRESKDHPDGYQTKAFHLLRSDETAECKTVLMPLHEYADGRTAQHLPRKSRPRQGSPGYAHCTPPLFRRRSRPMAAPMIQARHWDDRSSRWICPAHKEGPRRCFVPGRFGSASNCSPHKRRNCSLLALRTAHLDAQEQ